jgi:hypothetical protein
MTTELKEKIVVHTAQAAVVAATVGAIAKITYDVISIFKTLTK